MSNQPNNKQPRRGFRSPNYTQVPDELFDEYLADLSGAQLKVLLYIIRRTFGFKRDSDAISLSQICNGITTREGKVLDRGTGLSRRIVVSALQSLTVLGLIIAERRSSPEKGNEATVYHLNVSNQAPTPLVQKGNQGGSAKRELALVQKVHPQETVVQETEKDHHQEQPVSPTPATVSPSVSDDDDIFKLLRSQGIGREVALELAASPQRDLTPQQVAVYDWRRGNGERRGTGFLIASIQNPENYPIPDGYTKHLAEIAASTKDQEAEAVRRVEEQRQAEEDRRSQALEHLTSPEERARERVAFSVKIRAKSKLRLPAFTEKDKEREYERLLALYRSQAEEFFQTYPDLLAWAQAHHAPQPADQPTVSPDVSFIPSEAPPGPETGEVVSSDLSTRKTRVRRPQALSGPYLQPFVDHNSPAPPN
jgi:hypothetical protein